MRGSLKVSLFLLFMLAVAGPASAAPRIEADGALFDYGTVDELTSVQHVFVVRNRGDQPLEILKVESSCGCTTTKLDGTRIPPGGSTQLTASFNPRGRRGRQEKAIHISSNDPATPQLMLKLTGTVTAEVDTFPARVDFMEVREDEVRQKEVRITASVPMRILGVEVPNAPFIAVRRTTLEEGKSWLLTVSTVPPLPGGLSRPVITVRTDNPKYPVMQVPVTVQVPLDIVAVPAVLSVMQQPGGGSPPPVTVAVRSRSGKPFAITGVVAPVQGMTTRVDSDGPASYRVVVGNVNPSPQLNGQLLRIQTDNPAVRELRLPLQYIPSRPPQPRTKVAPAPGKLGP